MPMLSFLPWATIREPLRFGRFQLIPTGVALGENMVPDEHRDALAAILTAYDHARPVDQRSVPLLRRDDVALTADLTADEIAEYFGFRERLAFAVLSARKFFGHRYANADSVRLVVQAFTVEGAGGAVFQHRRRDGATKSYVPAGTLRVARQLHVGLECDMPTDLDAVLLEALEAAAVSKPDVWARIEEPIRLFVGANTDSPDVGMHSELIDVVGAFTRLSGGWDENTTVEAFLRVLPCPIAQPYEGPKLSHDRFATERAKGRSVREIWLRDAYRLRNQFGHGRVSGSPYSAVWSDREHLLLAATIFPLYVKALLRDAGLYVWTSRDALLDRAFDSLALLSPFETEVYGGDNRWQEVLDRELSAVFGERLERALEEAEPASPGDSAGAESSTASVGLDELEDAGYDPR